MLDTTLASATGPDRTPSRSSAVGATHRAADRRVPRGVASRFKDGLPAELTAVLATVTVAYLGCQVVRPGSGVTALDLLSLALVPLSVQVLRHYVWLLRYCAALVLWVVAMLGSAVVNGTGVATVTDDLALPGLQLTAVLVMVWLTDRLRSAIPVVLAAVGAHAYFVLYLYELPHANLWKYGLAAPVIALVLMGVAASPWPRLTGVCALGLLAGFSLVQDARAFAGACLLAAALLLVIRPAWRDRSALYFYGRVCLALTVILVAVTAAYAVGAGGGYLGAAAERKFVEQSAGGNVLLVARPELLFSLRAIAGSPLIGHGGAPSLTVQDVTNAVGRLSEAGAIITDASVARVLVGGVNAHSLIFQSWIDSGVLAVLPWVLLVGLGVRAVRLAPARWQPLVIFWTLMMAWDVLFSPWTPHVHFMLAAYVLFVCRICGDDAAESGRSGRWFRLRRPASAGGPGV